MEHVVVNKYIKKHTHPHAHMHVHVRAHIHTCWKIPKSHNKKYLCKIWSCTAVLLRNPVFWDKMLFHLVSGPNAIKDCTTLVHKGTMIIRTGIAYPVIQGHIPNYPNETSHFLTKIRSVHVCVMYTILIYAPPCTTDLFTLLQFLWKSKMVQNKPSPMLTKSKKPSITQPLIQLISLLNHRIKPILG
jgi:hypothetical protein